MNRVNERVLIQQEIALLKAKRSDDRKMIQSHLLETLDQLNPIKKIQDMVDNTIDQLNNKINFFNPIISKLKNWFSLI